MPTATYTPLATVTLGSSASSVTFSNIPATYRDLILVIQGTVPVASNIGLRFNGDSGSNYSYVYAFGSGSSTGTGSGTDTVIYGGAFNNTSISQSTFQIMDYSATDKHKTVLNRTEETNAATYMWADRWANTAAITTIQVRLSSGGNFNSASTFSLYGVIA